MKLYVRVAERKVSPRFPHQMTKNYCVWSALATEISKEER